MPVSYRPLPKPSFSPLSSYPLHSSSSQQRLLRFLSSMAVIIPSGGLSASFFGTTDRRLCRWPAVSVSFVSSWAAAPVPFVRAASSSKPSAAAGARLAKGITKPRPVSPAMQALVGVPEIPRTQALKLIWAYIKEHNLQDPNDKKVIICDEKLKAIFGGKDRVGFLEIAGLITPHFAK